jgi:uncharacterized protein
MILPLSPRAANRECPQSQNRRGHPYNRHGRCAMPVAMELRRIIISEIDDAQYIVLREVDGERSIPIVIGLFEAHSINRRVRGEESPRPLTHDLLVNVIDSLGGEVEDIVIHELIEHTYFAKLRIRSGGELVEIDCRPSDAIAVAVTAKVPIYITEDVLNDLDDSAAK